MFGCSEIISIHAGNGTKSLLSLPEGNLSWQVDKQNQLLKTYHKHKDTTVRKTTKDFTLAYEITKHKIETMSYIQFLDLLYVSNDLFHTTGQCINQQQF